MIIMIININVNVSINIVVNIFINMIIINIFIRYIHSLQCIDVTDEKPHPFKVLEKQYKVDIYNHEMGFVEKKKDVFFHTKKQNTRNIQKSASEVGGA